MATYISVRREAFERGREQMKKVSTAPSAYAAVRRPFRGIQERRDTYALIKVITDDGYEIPLLDSGGTPQFLDGSKGLPVGSTKPYSNFFIQQLNRAEAEKSQVIQTFGETFVHFYGKNPLAIQINGLLMNTIDFDWKNEWWYNYENYLRGTKLVENDARLYLFVGDTIYEGYLLRSTTNDVSDQPHLVSFSAVLFVTQIIPVNVLGSSNFPTGGIIQADPRSRTSLGKTVVGNTSSKAARSKYSYNYDEYVGTSQYWNSESPFDDTGVDNEADLETKAAAVLRGYNFSDDIISKVLNNGDGFTRTTESPFDDAETPFDD